MDKFRVPEQYRVTVGPLASAEGELDGAFSIPISKKKSLAIIATNGAGFPDENGDEWEHVSVSLPDRLPTYDEMTKIRALFWGPEALVMQAHPPKSEYINNHPYCLHMWRPAGGWKQVPPSAFVGVKGLEASHG